MSKMDTDCIKYVLDEMDPSERLEFERKLENDSNLLIEVESIRRIKRKLQSLPLVDPPKELTGSILQKAESLTKKNWNDRFHLKVSMVAAVLALSVSTGVLLTGESDNISNPLQENQQATIQSTFEGGQGVLEQQWQETERIQPWVDKNDVLYFGSQSGNSNYANFDSALQESYQKLSPVQHSSPGRFIDRGLHLTGSGN